MYAAGGGFGGALLAIIVAKILSGPCCCTHQPGAMPPQPASLSSAAWTAEPRPAEERKIMS
jgi:hypothetical protein